MEVLYLLSFLIFCFLQSLMIVGLKSCFEQGEIFEKVARLITYKLGPWWSRPVVGCVKCMSSLYGSITYWPVVLSVYGFEWWQVALWLPDLLIVLYFNWFLYKRQ